MNWKTLLSTPPPETVWSLDGQTVVVVHRDRKSGDRCAAVEVPESLFDIGPAGLKGLDGPRVTKVLTSLQEKIGGVRRAAIVVPTHWIRCFLMEAADLPRRRADLQDVLRWRLKKLLPVSPADLRIASSVQSPMGEIKQVLCSAAPEKALAALERAFEDAGISPGLIVPRIFALALQPENGAARRVIVQQEASVLSMAVVAAGGLRFIKTKPLPGSGMSWESAEREIGLAMKYIRNTMRIEGAIEAVISTNDEDLDRSIAGWFEGQPDTTTRLPDIRKICPDAHLAATLGRVRLAPMAAVLDGGAP